MFESANRVLIAFTCKDDHVIILAIRTDTGEVTAAKIEREIATWAMSLGSDYDRWMPIQRWRPVLREDIPVDKEFRGALIDDPKDGLVHDVDKAKVIAVDRVRELRNLELSRLDVQWMAALGQKDTATADLIEADRQLYRDQPNVLIAAIADVTSIADLKTAVVANQDAVQAARKTALPVVGSGTVVKG